MEGDAIIGVDGVALAGLGHKAAVALLKEVRGGGGGWGRGRLLPEAGAAMVPEAVGLRWGGPV